MEADGIICLIEGCDRIATGSRGWCKRHYTRWQRHGDPLVLVADRSLAPPKERFLEKVNFDGPLPGEDTLAAGLGRCHLWTAGTYDGYGRFWMNGRTINAHVAAYIIFVGDAPPHLVADHLCRRRECVNPSHVEWVTNEENVKRGDGITAKWARSTHCIHGHEFTPENTYRDRRGRSCRTCRRIRDRKYKAMRKASVIPAEGGE